jgi:hypothetical protein
MSLRWVTNRSYHRTSHLGRQQESKRYPPDILRAESKVSRADHPGLRAGSSIVPGKVNPVEVVDNDVAVGFGAAGGYREMNCLQAAGYLKLIVFAADHHCPAMPAVW